MTDQQLPPAKPLSTLSDLVVQFGKLRDGLLVSAGLLYILGYLTWSINAFQNNLGLLPAFDVQYFVAGIVPAAVIILALAAMRGVSAVGSGFNAWFKRERWARSRKFVQILIFVLSGGLVVGLFVLPENLKLLDYILVSSTFYFGYNTVSINSPDARRNANLHAYYGIIIGVFLAISFYIGTIYPVVPQEFGGVRPRCAFLAVPTSDLSDEISQALVANTVSATTGRVVQTRQVDVLYANSDIMLVRPAGQTTQNVYEIRRDIIQEVLWCG